MVSTEDILNKYGREMRFLKVAGCRWQAAGLGNSIKNQGVCDTHDFLWKKFRDGGDIW